tara:strand:+ start:473 stop:745 length:273 start_codon:yes stop_codon:yes gene_type:complete
MNNNFLSIFKSIKGSYNLTDFAQKSKGKTLPRSRKSFKKEYEVLKKYKDGLLLRNEAINYLINLKKINQRQAEKTLDNFESDKVIPMKIK